MTELKIGDRVAFYDGQRFIGRVTLVHGNDIHIETKDNEDFQVHRKQCWKLVKMKKCDACNGKGIHGLLPYSGNDWILMCGECGGKGKMKI